MNWIPEAKVGDKFRWDIDRVICKITRFKGIDVYYTIESGPRKGSWAWTTLPQNIELLTILDELAKIPE